MFVRRDDARAIRGNRQRPPLERLDRRPFGRETPRRATVDVLNVALRALADLLAEPDDVGRIQPAGIVEHDVVRVGKLCATRRDRWDAGTAGGLRPARQPPSDHQETAMLVGRSRA